MAVSLAFRSLRCTRGYASVARLDETALRPSTGKPSTSRYVTIFTNRTT